MKLLYFSALLTALFLHGCVQHVSPQETTQLQPLGNTVAFLPFHNDYLDLTGKLTTAASKQSRQSSTELTIVSSQKLQKARKALKLPNNFNMNNVTAIKLGNITGAHAVVFGHLKTPVVDENESYVERTKCKNAVCWRIKVACKKRTVRLAAEIKVLKVSTAEIIYDETLRKEQQWRHCADDGEHLPAIPTATQKLADKIAEDFTRHLTQLTVQF